MALLDKLSTGQERDWCAAAASEYGWSRDVLVHTGDAPFGTMPACG